MNRNQVKQLIKDHREEGETECRWCFAVDMQRVKARIIGQYDFSDATVLHLRCPRCDGIFSYYIRAWGKSYVKNIISRLHPELEGRIDDDLLRKINNRMWPEFENV